jgi:hypothetical protein
VVLVVMLLLLLIIYILGGVVMIDEKLMTNLYIYKVVCNPLLINPQIYKLLSCVALISAVYLGFEPAGLLYVSSQKG